jgi:hypothetical protein
VCLSRSWPWILGILKFLDSKFFTLDLLTLDSLSVNDQLHRNHGSFPFNPLLAVSLPCPSALERAAHTPDLDTECADSHCYLLPRPTSGKVSSPPTLCDKFLLYLFLYLYISLLGYGIFWRSVHWKFCSVICGANPLPYPV